MGTLWALSDLHLCHSVPDKDMYQVSPLWLHYQQRIQTNWINNIKPDDFVIIAGDISWANSLEKALIDIQWIDNLPGTKLIIKGNHDMWWPNASKLRQYLPTSIKILSLEPIQIGNFSIVGTRLWDSPTTICTDIIDWVGPPLEYQDTHANQKIFSKEIERLKIAVSNFDTTTTRIVVTHYPTIDSHMDGGPISDILEEFGVSISIFGHLHAIKDQAVFGHRNSVHYILTSADYLNFTPIKIGDI